LTTSIKPRANRSPRFLPFPKRNALFCRFELRLLFTLQKMVVHPHAAAVFLVCPFSAVVSLQHNTVHCMTFPFISISARICRSNLLRIRRPPRYNTRRFGIFLCFHISLPLPFGFLLVRCLMCTLWMRPSCPLWGVHFNQKGSFKSRKRDKEECGCNCPLPSP
jgi:hypothetical protein